MDCQCGSKAKTLKGHQNSRLHKEYLASLQEEDDLEAESSEESSSEEEELSYSESESSSEEEEVKKVTKKMGKARV